MWAKKSFKTSANKSHNEFVSSSSRSSFSLSLLLHKQWLYLNEKEQKQIKENIKQVCRAERETEKGSWTSLGTSKANVSTYTTQLCPMKLLLSLQFNSKTLEILLKSRFCEISPVKTKVFIVRDSLPLPPKVVNTLNLNFTAMINFLTLL